MKLSNDKLKLLTNDLVKWIREMMSSTGGEKAIIGISGGKDSSVVAGLCVRALGKENVLGILMPHEVQYDINYSHEICDFLGIKYKEVSITPMMKSFYEVLEDTKGDFIDNISEQTKLNLPPRIRMTLLYAISQSIYNGRVINTSNLSEDWVGYATVYGDTTGAFSPLATLTTDEVIQVGRYIGIPEKFIIKTPEDGLTKKTDEDVLGFSYDTLNRYIREGKIDDKGIKNKIDKMHKYSRFKFTPIPIYNSYLPIKAKELGNFYNDKK
ncbi:NAD(+) synthase [Senegalia massiliensis]|uniref:NH(3)-dependent NAD(+) synthetase n=1 Tax=Senegalia massiliensis TaxID=1720316 RepID=A0A845R645_9CLOT|nr:NAD(+) synthase [Senegalia massiliensis]NBI07973.1 NAD(+) synthase [Senegalia massiliensis]